MKNIVRLCAASILTLLLLATDRLAYGQTGWSYMTNYLSPTHITSIIHVEDWVEGWTPQVNFSFPIAYQFAFTTTIDHTGGPVPPGQPDPLLPTPGEFDRWGSFHATVGANSWTSPYLLTLNNSAQEGWAWVDPAPDGLRIEKVRTLEDNNTLKHSESIVYASLCEQISKHGDEKVLHLNLVNTLGEYTFWEDRSVHYDCYSEGSSVSDSFLWVAPNAGGIYITNSATATNCQTPSIEMPHMSVVYLWGVGTNINYEPLPGVGPGSHYLDYCTDGVYVWDGADESTTHHEATGGFVPSCGPQFFQVGPFISITNGTVAGGSRRSIVWYGLFADQLNATAVGTARNALPNYITTPGSSSTQIGLIVTYAVEETRPPLPISESDDLGSYCFQVAAKLGGALRTVPIYDQ